MCTAVTCLCECVHCQTMCVCTAVACLCGCVLSACVCACVHSHCGVQCRSWSICPLLPRWLSTVPTCVTGQERLVVTWGSLGLSLAVPLALLCHSLGSPDSSSSLMGQPGPGAPRLGLQHRPAGGGVGCGRGHVSRVGDVLSRLPVRAAAAPWALGTVTPLCMRAWCCAAQLCQLQGKLPTGDLLCYVQGRALRCPQSQGAPRACALVGSCPPWVSDPAQPSRAQCPGSNLCGPPCTPDPCTGHQTPAGFLGSLFQGESQWGWGRMELLVLGAATLRGQNQEVRDSADPYTSWP